MITSSKTKKIPILKIEGQSNSSKTKKNSNPKSWRPVEQLQDDHVFED